MKNTLCSLSLLATLAFPTSQALAGEDNTLTPAEKEAGWELLFDGKSLEHWRTLGKDTVVGEGWAIEQGTLKKVGGVRSGNIITRRTWTDYEFSWEWKLDTKGNNGVKYMVLEKRGAIGHEYQMLDQADHNNSVGSTGSFYAVLAPNGERPQNPAGKWNHSIIKVKANRVEHWLNGEKVLEYELGSTRVLEGVARSKFKKFPGFGTKVEGHILLTDHKDVCWFRNLKIRVIRKP